MRRAVIGREEEETVARDGEAERVRSWLIDRFDGLGFSPGDAIVLADSGADWRLAARLLRDGATLEQTRRIVL